MHPPAEQPRFIQADAVAALIGMSDGAAFLRRRADLERDNGFPRPMPTSRRPLIWRRDAVSAWADAQGTSTSATVHAIPLTQHRLLQMAATR